MNPQHEAIFRKALASIKPEAIMEVARAFEGLDNVKAWQLYQRAYGLGQAFAFGAMVRGTAIKGTNGAVIPPGRYWIDISSGQQKAFTDWVQSKPEVKVETTEGGTDAERLFIIISIPPTANNYGLPGVFYPTQVLGFPDIAGSNVHSSQDVMKVPDAPTSADVLADMAAAMGKAAGAAGKGAASGLGISTTTLVLIGVGTLFGLFMLNRLMMPPIRLPI